MITPDILFHFHIYNLMSVLGEEKLSSTKVYQTINIILCLIIFRIINLKDEINKIAILNPKRPINLFKAGVKSDMAMIYCSD